MIGRLVLGAAGAIGAAPFVKESLKPKMTAAVRATAPGSFAQLSRGITHYQWCGPDDGPVAVCVHGLTTPSYVWGPIADGLAARGFRVLTYDLYGRGYSDRPGGAQDSAFFMEQLNDLLAHQGVSDGFTLLGYSMGGAIAAAFAAHYPARLKRAILLAPAGMGHDLGPVARLVTGYGGLGKWMMYAFYAQSYSKSLEAERDVPTAVDNIVDLQLREMRYRGFVPAVHSSMCEILGADLTEEHRRIAETDLPVLAIWGRDDDVIPIAGMEKLRLWNPNADHEVIESAGHALAYTHPQQVLAALDPHLT